MQQMKTKQLIFSAMAIALAITIATVIKLPSLPNGGSVTLFSMLMISMIGYWYGPKISLTAALAYGILQFITGPYVLSPLQVILDYPLAFGALGLSGLCANKKNGLVYGYLLSVTGRYFFSMLSGLIFFTTYTGSFGNDLSAIWAAFAYNFSYIGYEAIITLILLNIPAVKNAMEKIKQMAL